MRSDEILTHFTPIKFEDAKAYLNNMKGCLGSLCREFAQLPEEEMANYKYPDYVSHLRTEIENSRHGRYSADYKYYNTAVTAINLLRNCAQINMAIHAFLEKYKAQEIELAEKNPTLSRYQDYLNNQSSFPEKYTRIDWHNSTDESVLKIKNAAIQARDQIHGYSKKYTIDGFEEDFINTIKYKVYSICDKFMVNTKTIGEKATDTGASAIGGILHFALLLLLFFLVAKCASNL